MATTHCWAVWQRLPPRYQLSTRGVDDGFGESRFENNIPRSLHDSFNPKYKGTALSGLHPYAQKERLNTVLDQKKLAFPMRSSSYISTMKSQQRVNSARQKLATDPSCITYVPKIKKKLTPEFPLTRLSHVCSWSLEDYEWRNRQSDDNRHLSAPGSANQKRLAVHTILPFEDEKNQQQSRALDQKKYIVNDLNNATMYIDRDKIIYFKRTKPKTCRSMDDVIGPYSAKHDDGSYLAHLRKTYLKPPKRLVKSNSTPEIHTRVHDARSDYDKKVGHILEYYSVDESGRSIRKDPTDNDKTTAPLRRKSAGVRGRLKSPGPGGSRLRSLLSSPTMETPLSTPVSLNRVPDLLEEWGLYLKLNQRAILHDKQFYLKTPDLDELITDDRKARQSVPNCKCRLCQMELMELAVLSELDQMRLDTNPEISVDNEVRSEYDPNNACPGRPNSAAGGGTRDRYEVVKDETFLLSPTDLRQDVQGKVCSGSLTVTLPEITGDNFANNPIVA